MKDTKDVICTVIDTGIFLPVALRLAEGFKKVNYHVPNIAVHWAVNRGAAKIVIPKAYATLWQTSARAIDAVLHQNEDYLAMLESGVNLMYHNQVGNTLHALTQHIVGNLERL